jgi:divalent metal cation (Fe/Co/Zn/Cd) transporter
LNENKSDNWIDLHNLRTIKYGSVLHVDCHLTVPWYLHVRDAHREVEKLENLIRINFPRSVEMFVHTDGCIPPEACAVCPVQSCAERKAAFVQRLDWTFENLTSNNRHKIR